MVIFISFHSDSLPTPVLCYPVYLYPRVSLVHGLVLSLVEVTRVLFSVLPALPRVWIYSVFVSVIISNYIVIINYIYLYQQPEVTVAELTIQQTNLFIQ